MNAQEEYYIELNDGQVILAIAVDETPFQNAVEANAIQGYWLCNGKTFEQIMQELGR